MSVCVCVCNVFKTIERMRDRRLLGGNAFSLPVCVCYGTCQSVDANHVLFFRITNDAGFCFCVWTVYNKGQLRNNVTGHHLLVLYTNFDLKWGVSCPFGIKEVFNRNFTFLFLLQQHLIIYEISYFMGDCDYCWLFGRISIWVSMAILVVASLSTWLLQIQRISK